MTTDRWGPAILAHPENLEHPVTLGILEGPAGLAILAAQRRLADLGYNDAVGDKDGWYGELTALAVKAFQKDKGLDSTGLMDEATFTKLFQGDTNVEVILN